MKVSQLLPSTQPLPIAFPDGEPTGITLKVISSDSRVPASLARTHYQELGKSSKVDLLDAERRNIEVCAACIVGWTGLEDDEGNPLPYSPEQAKELLARTELSFVREQVQDFVAKRTNFFRRGSGEARADSATAHPA